MIAIIIFCVTAILALCSLPLSIQYQWGLDLGNITANPDLFAFDLKLQATNYNVATLSVASVSLDVYASPPDFSNEELQHLESREELLGHVKYFEKKTVGEQQYMNQSNYSHAYESSPESPLPYLPSERVKRDKILFPPLSESSQSGHVAIHYPRNTIGKIIYMNFPYTLKVIGHVKYSVHGIYRGHDAVADGTGVSLFTRIVPICSTHAVYQHRIISASCLVPT